MSIIRDAEKSNQQDTEIKVPVIATPQSAAPAGTPAPPSDVPSVAPVQPVDVPVPTREALPTLEGGDPASGAPDPSVDYTTEDMSSKVTDTLPGVQTLPIGQQTLGVPQQDPTQVQQGQLAASAGAVGLAQEAQPSLTPEQLLEQQGLTLPKQTPGYTEQPVPMGIPGVDQSAISLQEYRANTEAQVQQSIDATKSKVPLPDDLVLPTVFAGNISGVQEQLDQLGRMQQQNYRASEAQDRQSKQALWDAANRFMAQVEQDKQRNPWAEFAFGQGDPTRANDFAPLQGKFGDYGSGAVGAVFGALNYLPTALITRGLITGGADIANQAKAAWNAGNPFSAGWLTRFNQNLEANAPDIAGARAAKRAGDKYAYWRATSYFAGALTGRDYSFSNWQTDKYGRYNPLGFLYGDQKQNEGKVDWLKGATAFALDVFVDPGGMLLKKVGRGGGFLGLKKTEQLVASEATQALSKEATREATRAAVREEMVGVAQQISDPLRRVERPLPNSGGVMRPAQYGSASVTPAAVYKEYLLRAKRPALPPARDTGNVIEATYEVVSAKPGQVIDVSPPVPTIRQSAQAILDGVPSEDVAKAFTQLDGREFPAKLVQEELDRYAEALGKAKSDRGTARAYNQFQARLGKLEQDFDKRVGRAAEVTELPAKPNVPVSDNASRELSRDYYLAGVSEPPLKALPSVGDTGRGQRLARLTRLQELPNSGGVLQRGTSEAQDKAIDEGIREFRRVESMPVLPPAKEGYAEYIVQRYPAIEMPRKRVFRAELDNRPIETVSYDAPPVLTVIDGEGNAVALRVQPIADTMPRPLRNVGDATIERMSPSVLATRADYYDELSQVSEDVLAKLGNKTREAVMDIMARAKTTTDGVVLWDTGDVRSIVTQQGGRMYVDPRAVPIDVLMPQRSAGDYVQRLLSGDVIDVPKLMPRTLPELNQLAKFLPGPDGLALVGRDYDTYEGLMSAISQRLYGLDTAQKEGYFAVLRRVGAKFSDSSVLADDTEELLVEVMRGTSQNPQGTAIIPRALPVASDLPKALNDGTDIEEQVLRAIQQGLDPEDLLKELAEPNLADPKTRDLILKATPDELVGTSQIAQDMAVGRVIAKQELAYLGDTRGVLEGQQKAVEEVLERSLARLDELPDLAPQVLTDAVPFTSKEAAKDYVRSLRVSGEVKALTETQQQAVLDATPELAKRIGSTSEPVATQYYHGTRVDDLDLSRVDWAEGAARGEFGTAIYLTKNPEMADSFAKADVVHNLPIVEGREFSVPRVHTVELGQMNILKADTKMTEPFKDVLFRSLDAVINQQNPVHKDLRNRLLKAVNGHNLSIGKAYDLMSTLSARARAASLGVEQVDEKLVLAWQRQLNTTLREAGVDAIEHGDVIAVLGNEKLTTRAVRELADEDTPLAVAVHRYNGVTLAAQNYPKSKMLEVTSKEMQARVMSRMSDAMQEELDKLDDAIIRKLDTMQQGDDQLRKLAKKEQAELQDNIAKSTRAKDDQTIEQLSKYTDNPCL